MEKEPLQSQRKSRKTVIISFAILSIVLVVGISFGVYTWQHNKVTSLNRRIDDLRAKSSNSSNSAASKSTGTFSYSPKTGGLTLKLSKDYGIIVQVDGNKGGAPGATFRVAKVVDSNIFTDSDYQGVQVDVDHSATDLNREVSVLESELTEAKTASNFEVSDTTVANLPAKLITAEGGDEYVGNLNYYIVNSGEFEYTITSNNPSNSEVLEATLKGLSLRPANLE